MTKRPPKPLRKHLAALVAVVALLGQAFFPHVHPFQFGHARGGLAAASERGGDGHQHSPASCPLCRAQNGARSSLLPATLAVPLPAAAPALVPATTVVTLTAAVPRL